MVIRYLRIQLAYDNSAIRSAQALVSTPSKLEEVYRRNLICTAQPGFFGGLAFSTRL